VARPGGGALWFIAEKPTGSLIGRPEAMATVYRWSGSGWLRQGALNRVPTSLNYYTLSGGDDVTYGQFEAVTVPGAADPGFVLGGSGASRPEVLTDAGGRWHAARYR